MSTLQPQSSEERTPRKIRSHILGSTFVPTDVRSPELGESSLGMLVVAELSAELTNHLAPISEEVRANKCALDKLQGSILQLSTQIEASKPACFDSFLQQWDAALEKLGLHLKESKANQQLLKANLDRLQGTHNSSSQGSLCDIDNTVASHAEHAPSPPVTVALEGARSMANSTSGGQDPGSPANDGSSVAKATRRGCAKTLTYDVKKLNTTAKRNNMLSVVVEHLQYMEDGTLEEAPIKKFYLHHVREFMEWLSNLQEPPRRSVLAKVVDSRAFGLFFGLVIIANVIILSADATHQMNHSGDHVFEQLDWLFLVCYSAEVAMKLAVHHWYFFVGPDYGFNIFDTFLVVVSLYSNVMSLLLLNKSASAASAQTLRIFKVVRVFKAIRLIRFFSIMESILNVMSGTLLIFFGGVLTLILLLFVFGLVCVQLLSDAMHNVSDPVLHEEARSIFGSVQLGMFTLFRSACNGEDWNKYFRIVSQISLPAAAIFMFFVALVHISFFNILLAMIVVQTKKLGKPDQETKAMEETLNQLRNREQIEELCRKMDKDGSQTISREEFYESLESEYMHSQFMLCGLNINNAEDFFELLLTTSNDNEVEIKRFVTACMMVKGGATAIEQNMILLEARDFQKRVSEHFFNLKHWQAQVIRRIDALDNRSF